jgi:photosystem II stability/assembly factor-like uncharacterized protein
MSGKPLLFLMVLSQLSFAGWEIVPSGLTDDLSAAAFVNADTGYIVGAHGACLRTEDAGKTWKPADLGARNDLTGVRFLDARRGFVCGLKGLILRTVDSGRTWEKAATPDSGRIEDITFASPAVGYAMGKQDSILATSDSGKTWTARKIYEGDKHPFTSVRACFPTEKIGYLVTLMQLFKTENGGLTWNPAVGVSWGSSYLSDCWFSNPDTGFVAAITYGSLVRTNDGGKTTRMVLGHTTTAIRFLDPDIGYSTSGLDISRSANGGNDWTRDLAVREITKGDGYYSLRDLAINGGPVVLAVGTSGLILRKVEGESTGLAPSANSNSKVTSDRKAFRLDGRALPRPAKKPKTPIYKR